MLGRFRWVNDTQAFKQLLGLINFVIVAVPTTLYKTCGPLGRHIQAFVARVLHTPCGKRCVTRVPLCTDKAEQAQKHPGTSTKSNATDCESRSQLAPQAVLLLVWSYGYQTNRHRDKPRQ